MCTFGDATTKNNLFIILLLNGMENSIPVKIPFPQPPGVNNSKLGDFSKTELSSSSVMMGPPICYPSKTGDVKTIIFKLSFKGSG